MSATNEGGDKVELEGRFGSPVPASESDVNQTALSECPGSAADGRAMIVRLDLVAALDSSLTADVDFETSFVRADRPLDFVMGFNPPTCVLGETGGTSVNLGTIQPQQSASFTMWIVLPDVITPDDPRPSEQTLEQEGWFIEVPILTLNGRPAGISFKEPHTASGSRVVKCQDGGAVRLAVIGGTPQTLTEQSIGGLQRSVPGGVGSRRRRSVANGQKHGTFVEAIAGVVAFQKVTSYGAVAP